MIFSGSRRAPAKHVLVGAMFGGAFALFRLANGKNGLILKYHRFSEESSPRAVSRHIFAQHLHYLTRRYALVPVSKMVSHFQAGTTLSRPMAAITIDDGHRDAYDIAFPILKQFGAPATLFVVTGFLDGTCWLWTDQIRYVFTRTRVMRATIALGPELLDLPLDDSNARVAAAALVNDRLKRMPEGERNGALNRLSDSLGVEVPKQPPAECAPITWEQARELDQNGVAVESHSVTHSILTNVQTDQLRHELAESKARLEAALGRRAATFCYPNGNWNREVRDAVEHAGYTSAVTTAAGLNERGADPFRLKRIDGAGDLPRFAKTTSGFEVWESGVRQAGFRFLATRLTRR